MGITVDSKRSLVVDTSGRGILRAVALLIAIFGVGISALGIWNRDPLTALAGLAIMAVGVLPPEYGSKGLRIDVDDERRHVEVHTLGGVTGRTLDRAVSPAERPGHRRSRPSPSAGARCR